LLDFDSGKPVAPNLATLEVNLIGTIYTTHLALYYMKCNRASKRNPAAWKALILIGSMAAWQAIPLAPMYSSSKAGVLALMRSIDPLLQSENIRTAVIDAWFADTALVPISAKLLLAGSPLTPVSRIAKTIFYSAADPDPQTSGCPWLLPDEGPVMRLAKEELTAGVYEIINSRIARIRIAQGNLQLMMRTMLNIVHVCSRQRFLRILAVVLGILAFYFVVA